MRIYRNLIITGGVILLLGGLLAVKLKDDVPQQEAPMKLGSAQVNVIVTDALEKVFQKRLPSNVKPAVDVAAGETATFQLVVNSGKGDITELKAVLPDLKIKGSTLRIDDDRINIGYLGYVKVNKNLATVSPGFRMASDAYYPDPIRRSVGTVKQNTNQPIWISVQVPAGQKAGNYGGVVSISGKVNGQPFSINQQVDVHVYPVVLQETNRLWVSNWWTVGPVTKKLLTGNADITGMLAEKMSENGINSFIANGLMGIDITENNGKYAFDYKNFDNYVETFLKAGLRKRIEGGFIAGRSGNWTSNYQVFLPVNTNGKITFQKVDPTDRRVDNFYRQYFPDFVNHLKTKNYFSIFYQHVADEPVDQNVASYNQVLGMVKKYAPELKTIDAVQTDRIGSQLDVVVPVLDVLERRYNSFRKIQQSGREVAFYTCWQPQGKYANRLIQMDLLKTRYLPWINFKYGLSGFMHWGFNQWSGDPLNVADNVAGDAWIVYPENNKVISSIRLDAFRDGINDYALLYQLSRKSPDKANQLAGRIIQSFSAYDLDITDFRQARRELLQALSR